MAGHMLGVPSVILTAEEERLRKHVRVLCGDVGSRSIDESDSLDAAAHYIESEFKTAGLTVHRQEYEANGTRRRTSSLGLPASQVTHRYLCLGLITIRRRALRAPMTMPAAFPSSSKQQGGSARKLRRAGKICSLLLFPPRSRPSMQQDSWGAGLSPRK